MLLTRPTNRSRTLVAGIFAMLATGAGDRPQAQTPKVGVGVIWTGTASGEDRRIGVGRYILPAVGKEPGGPSDQSGTVVTSWKGTYRLKEGEPVNVKDASGNVVGRLVPLLDDGSKVALSMSGRMSETSPYGDVEHWDYSGADVAPEPNVVSVGGGAFSQGWVYYSLATQDPLADILPNGSYSLMGAPMVVNRFTVRVTEIDVGHAYQPHVNTMKTGGSGALMGGWSMWGWGKLTAAERAARGGFGDGGMSISVEGVRRALASTAAVMKPFFATDPKTYVIKDSAMDGTMARVPKLSLTERYEGSSSWHIERKLQINGILTATDGAWRPKFLGKTSFTASMPESLGATGKFRFTLYDVSREPGIALNDGTDLIKDQPGLDLKFSDEQATTMTTPVRTSDGWTVETSATAASAAVSVTALDYGAWGKLKAEVNVDGEWYECLSPDGKASVTLPLDTNGNHIWDTWERNSGVWGKPAAEDGDETPEGAGKGDGFSNFEEYRGFMVAGTWVSTDPAAKDLFVFDEAGWGTGVFFKTGILIYQIDQDDMNSKRVVNFNRGTSTAGAQKALHVKDDRLPPGILGLTYIGSPNQTHEVLLDLQQLKAESADAIGSIIAHELGHGVGVEHHGDYTERTCHGGPKGLYAPQGGAWSGDRGCVMSYSAALYYAGWDGKCYDYTWPSEFGTAFCSARTGTGLNAGPKHMADGHPLPVSGNATHGNCLHQLRLK